MANWRQQAAAAATGGVDYVDRLQKGLPDKEVGSDRECAEGPHPRLVLVRACAGSPTLSQASASRLKLARSRKQVVQAVPGLSGNNPTMRPNGKEPSKASLVWKSLLLHLKRGPSGIVKGWHLTGQSTLARSVFRSFTFFRSATSICSLHQSAAENLCLYALLYCTLADQHTSSTREL